MLRLKEKRIIEEQMKKIIPIFLDEFIEYVYVDKRMYLRNEVNIPFVINYDNGFGAWAKGDEIFFAFENTQLFYNYSRRKIYGKKKGPELIEEENFIDNDKDYIDYLNYFIDYGLREKDYYLDVLPHVIMHLIGCGNSLLDEGITELRTRQLCKKYGIRCAPVMHTKETKLVRMLEKYIEPRYFDVSVFSSSDYLILNECDKIFGPKFRELYNDLSIEYREYTIDNSQDPFEHYEYYRKLNFEPLYTLIKEKENHPEWGIEPKYEWECEQDCEQEESYPENKENTNDAIF